MQTEELKKSLSASLSSAECKERDPDSSGLHLEVALEPRHIRTLIRHFQEAGFYLETITAADFPEHFELYYIVCQIQPLLRVMARTRLSKDAKAVSIAGIYQGAAWMEREVYDFYGIEFLGHPDLKRILLPDDATIFPLRKDFGKTKATQVIDELL